MAWIRFGKRSSAPLDALLNVLDAHLPDAAASIRRTGQPAVERFLAEAAAHVRQANVWLRATRVVAAAAAYDKATRGADWSAMPSEHVRARQAPTLEEVIERRRRREAVALKRIRERSNGRTLAQLRAATIERTN